MADSAVALFDGIRTGNDRRTQHDILTVFPRPETFVFLSPGDDNTKHNYGELCPMFTANSRGRRRFSPQAGRSYWARPTGIRGTEENVAGYTMKRELIVLRVCCVCM